MFRFSVSLEGFEASCLEFRACGGGVGVWGLILRGPGSFNFIVAA